MKYRCIPPTGVTAARIYGGTTDAVSSSGVADVGAQDAAELRAQGWLGIPGMLVGATAKRPTAPGVRQNGTLFLDTTIGKVIVWNGAAWIDVVTGAEPA